MSAIRRLALPTLALVVLAALPAGLVAQDAGSEEPGDGSYFSPDGGVAEAAVLEIDRATDAIDIAMYSISTGSSAPIFAALERAGQRDVEMRMVLNKARYGARNKQKSLALEDIGVDVRYVTKTMHEKFAVVDGNVLLTGSANWSVSADRSHSENMQVLVRPQYLIRQFEREFRTLIERSRDFDPEDYR